MAKNPYRNAKTEKRIAVLNSPEEAARRKRMLALGSDLGIGKRKPVQRSPRKQTPVTKKDQASSKRISREVMLKKNNIAESVKKSTKMYKNANPKEQVAIVKNLNKLVKSSNKQAAKLRNKVAAGLNKSAAKRAKK